MTNDMLDYISKSQDELVSLTYALCAIPAPSHHEEKRARFCQQWLSENGLADVLIDEALNVVWEYNPAGHDKCLLMAAHTDTVFPDTAPFSVRVENGVAHCPGICDDTVCVAMLMLLMRYVNSARPATECGLLFSLNSCEEGLGNLKGIRRLMADYGARVREFATLDGAYPRICDRAVGSTRYRVSVDTEGGHSFNDFGNRNAIERLSRIIARLYAVEIPRRPGAKTTFNVGGISGGTSVNTIAQHAEMLYEYRSDCLECLEVMKRAFDEIIENARGECLAVNVEVLGERPCAKNVDPARQAALISRCEAAITQATGLETERRSGSTDCNIPLSMGVPSLCFGGYQGGGGHTREEYLKLDSLPQGFVAVGNSLASYFIEG